PAGEKPVKPTTDTPDKPKPEKPVDPTKPKPDKPKPEGAPGIKLGGAVGAVDAAARTGTPSGKGRKGPAGRGGKRNPDARVVIDGKPGELSAVPKGSLASISAAALKDGAAEASEVRVTGPSVTGIVTTVNESSVTIEYGSKDGKTTREIKLAPGG